MRFWLLINSSVQNFLERNRTILVSIVLSTFLPACGGGTNSSHPSQTAPTQAPQVQAATNEQNQNEVRWNEMDSASSYRIYYSSDSNLSPGNTRMLDVYGRSYVPTGQKGETVYVAISALWGENEGPRSTIVAITISETVDPIAPKVIAVFPNDKKTDIDINIKKIDVSFDKVMAAASINGDSFQIRDALGLVGGKFEFDVTGKTVSFLPNSPLFGNTQYTIFINQQAIDSEGHALGSEYRSVFTTGLVSVAIESAQASESSGKINVAVKLSAMSSPVDVDFSTADNTATAGSDYSVLSGTIHFDAGETSKSISIALSDDNIYENVESFYLKLSNAVGAKIAGDYAIVTLNDDEAPSSISVADILVNEGAGKAGVVVSLDHPCAYPINVNYETQNVTANAPGDFTLVPPTQLSFSPGQTTSTISITLVNDTIWENTETFFVNLSGASVAQIADYQAQITIQDDDVPPPPTLSLVNGDGQVTLSWNDALGATSYNIYYARQSGVAPSNYGALTGGTAVIGTTSPRTINGLANGQDYFFVVTAQSGNIETTTSNQTGAQPRSLQVVQPKLNDTGINTCSNASANGLSCPQTGFPNQDGDIGRDAQARAGTLQKIGAGISGFDYTKIGDDGQALANQNTNYATTPWSCVRDNVTGLWWEVKTDDNGFRDKDWTYVRNSQFGIPNDSVCFDKQISGCATGKFTTEVNKVGLCGFNDWRMPTESEYRTTINFGIASPGPTVDANYFPNTKSARYWSSTLDNYNSGFSAYIDFSSGDGSTNNDTTSYNVRLVRAGP